MILLNKRWRITESRETPPHRQWLLQRWNKAGWSSESYCQTRSGLQAAIKSKVDYVEQAGLDAVASLPERIA